MAPPPVKSQPLHNFPLSQLRWVHKKSSSSAAGSVPQHHRSRRRDSPDQGGRRFQDPDHNLTASNPPADSSPKYTVQDANAAAAAEEENEETKPWNLRPRKVVDRDVFAPRNHSGCVEKSDKKNTGNCSVIKSQRLRDMAIVAHNGGSGREGKRKVWISLSKEEIEEDVYAFTGGRPSRRPRKWPKNVQKQLNNVFPGMYLVGVAADSYRVMMSRDGVNCED